MSIDIRGVHDANRGAQLMLRAAAERLGEHFEVSSNPYQGTYAFRSALGLGQTLHHLRFPRASRVVGDLAPGKVTRLFGMVRDKDITGVVDASGFAYSDSFGLKRHQREAVFGARWAARGVPRVMLPQAFGPFTDQAKAQLTKQIVSQSALVFARDEVSLGYLRSLGADARIERSVDFTIGLRPPTIEPIAAGDFAAVVPNAKLVASGKIEREAYVALLASYADAASSAGLSPVIVVHEDGDARIAEALAERVGAPTYAHPDPLVLKAALGQAGLVVASRFHAVVGALSQSVPTVALGWSHKYAELLRDFEVAEWNAAVDDDAAQKVALAVADATAASRLTDIVPALKAQNDHMWQLTIEALRGA